MSNLRPQAVMRPSQGFCGLVKETTYRTFYCGQVVLTLGQIKLTFVNYVFVHFRMNLETCHFSTRRFCSVTKLVSA